MFESCDCWFACVAIDGVIAFARLIISTCMVIGLGTLSVLGPCVPCTIPFFFKTAASTVLGLKAAFFAKGDMII